MWTQGAGDGMSDSPGAKSRGPSVRQTAFPVFVSTGLASPKSEVRLPTGLDFREGRAGGGYACTAFLLSLEIISTEH